jgi:glycerate dehydrogenase
MGMKIVFLDAFTANPGDQSWSEFEKLGECQIFDRTPVSEIVERAADAEIIITNKAPLSRETLFALPKLKYVGVVATGFNVVDVAAAKERGIVVTNVPGYGTPAVAQAVIAMMLELTNHTAHHAKTVREGRWSSCPDFCYWDFPIVELQGRTLGLVGFGDIGSAVARVALAFGMKVIAARRSWTVPPPEGVIPATVDEVLEQSDVISLHCPLTDETRHLINADTLSRMKRSAFLINTARGPLVDEAALAAALNEGSIAGAAVDVLSSEPPPETNPLLQAKNCVITPHLAWASREARTRLIAEAAENVNAFINGAPRNVVNP